MADFAAIQSIISSLYLLLAGVFVIFMMMGLTLFTAGLIRSTNTVTLLMSNIIAFAIISCVFLGFGYEFTFMGNNPAHIYFPSLSKLLSKIHWHHLITDQQKSVNIAFIFYQLTLVTVVSAIIVGATSERMRPWSLWLFFIFLSGLIYPLVAYWTIAGGYLQHIGFIDKAGAGLVHFTAGVSALAAVLVLGPRAGKYSKSKRVNPIFASNMPLAVIGIFLMWIGSLGLNSGYLAFSQKTMQIQNVAVIFINSIAASSASTIIVTLISRILFGKIDITLILNASIIGLVSISASPAQISLSSAVLIGAVCGLLTVLMIILLDKLKIDDPIGAISVHGFCGMLSLIFAAFTYHNHNPMITWWRQLIVQVNGIVLIFLWVFICSIVVWFFIKFIAGIRVTEMNESRGLDIVFCGNKAYPEFIKNNS